MGAKNKAKLQGKVYRPKKSEKSAPSGASGVEGSGGSREGDIGHQADDQSDNSHR